MCILVRNVVFAAALQDKLRKVPDSYPAETGPALRKEHYSDSYLVDSIDSYV